MYAFRGLRKKDRSLARGRTIELFNEEHTEEESFKGVMAMGGCLLLVMALGVLFVAVVVEGLRLPGYGPFALSLFVLTAFIGIVAYRLWVQPLLAAWFGLV